MSENKTSQAYMEAMKRMDDEMASMPMSGEPGVDFARMMIPHHQSAIDMAKAYLESGENDPTIRKIAEDVVASQAREIGELRDWLTRKDAR
ncbi:CopM family metallochaperone [Aureimonas ureilytica]|uniref:CopM family metallochaperone n=1 Tax=Aureimonas ureilytica TaxID=401562 RepID=UPI003CF10E73